MKNIKPHKVKLGAALLGVATLLIVAQKLWAVSSCYTPGTSTRCPPNDQPAIPANGCVATAYTAVNYVPCNGAQSTNNSCNLTPVWFTWVNNQYGIITNTNGGIIACTGSPTGAATTGTNSCDNATPKGSCP